MLMIIIPGYFDETIVETKWMPDWILPPELNHCILSLRYTAGENIDPKDRLSMKSERMGEKICRLWKHMELFRLSH